MHLSNSVGHSSVGKINWHRFVAKNPGSVGHICIKDRSRHSPAEALDNKSVLIAVIGMSCLYFLPYLTLQPPYHSLARTPWQMLPTKRRGAGMLAV